MILFLLASALSICALLLLRAAWRYRQLYRYLMALDVSQLDAPAPPPALARFSPVHGKLRSLLLERHTQDVTHRQLHFLALQSKSTPISSTTPWNRCAARRCVSANTKFPI